MVNLVNFLSIRSVLAHLSIVARRITIRAQIKVLLSLHITFCTRLESRKARSNNRDAAPRVCWIFRRYMKTLVSLYSITSNSPARPILINRHPSSPLAYQDFNHVWFHFSENCLYGGSGTRRISESTLRHYTARTRRQNAYSYLV